VNAIRVLAANVALSALMIGAAVLILASDRVWPFRLPAQLVPAFWPLLVVGSLLIVAAVGTFERAARASGAIGDAPGELVTRGPYRLMRNPIYVGVAFLLFGVAFFRQSPSFLVSALVFGALIDVYVRRVEEPRLEARFGDSYAAYKRVVPRWLPKLRPSPD
jgi:protein-S-isoprenylcysteine O-methyltransferase Ste14